MPRGSLAPLPLVLLCVLTLAGCLIDRGSLVAPPTGLDAGPRPDAFLEPGTDTGPPREDPDAHVEPEIDAYVEPSPDAGLCDEVGEGCCGMACSAGLSCSASGRCDITGCGGVGAPCCLDSVCFGTNGCVGGTCAHCGAEGEVCCASATCDSGLACAGDRCAPCGNIGQSCCGGGCLTGSCNGGTCRAPEGARGGPCRMSLDACDEWASCDFGTGICQGCGMRGESCCGLGRCQGGTSCNWGGRCE